ncbi:transcription factor bHLH36-like [Hevea brasiliensis]|uniref:transcription factor bHLH36-like n=1 Tax=Hevea brasiliensis TaxID=3981 RepID=UPI0025E98092|nr:transcription factor bHLH36-like [Hevea brasiliensis]
MFPSHQNNELSFEISSTPYQENTIPQDLILSLQGHSTVDGIDPSKKNKNGKDQQRNPCFSHKKDENSAESSTKRTMHREIERRRRQDMATLYTSLRNLLPLEYIKGKRAISDHIHQTVKYIKDLQKKIKELSVHRDEMKNLSSLRVLGHEAEVERLNSFAPTSVVVRSSFVGVEVVINSGFGKQVLHISRVLQLLLEEGLSVVSCISTKVNQRVIHTIQSEVSYMTCIDISELQNKLIEAIPSTSTENSN